MPRKKTNEMLEKIIEATVWEIAANGPVDTSLEKIAERAGVARGTVYSYFQTKEEVLRAGLERRIRILQDRFGPLPERGIPPDAAYATAMELCSVGAILAVHNIGLPKETVREALLLNCRSLFRSAWDSAGGNARSASDEPIVARTTRLPEGPPVDLASLVAELSGLEVPSAAEFGVETDDAEFRPAESTLLREQAFLEAKLADLRQQRNRRARKGGRSPIVPGPTEVDTLIEETSARLDEVILLLLDREDARIERTLPSHGPYESRSESLPPERLIDDEIRRTVLKLEASENEVRTEMAIANFLDQFEVIFDDILGKDRSLVRPYVREALSRNQRLARSLGRLEVSKRAWIATEELVSRLTDDGKSGELAERTIAVLHLLFSQLLRDVEPFEESPERLENEAG